jgi:hypothetical protein
MLINRINIILVFICGIFLTSCFRDVHRSVVRKFPIGGMQFEIRSMNSGCCGCMMIYANTYKSNRIEEQLLHEYKCGFGEPTKYTYSYDQKGKIQTATALIAVFDSSYTIPITSEELTLLRKFDSLLPSVGGKNGVYYSSIKGFRPKVVNERIQPFGYDMKGKVVYPSTR